jgi:hypothetical protein
LSQQARKIQFSKEVCGGSNSIIAFREISEATRASSINRQKANKNLQKIRHVSALKKYVISAIDKSYYLKK